MIQSYRDLVVWQKSTDLVEMIYQISHAFPASERFGLTSQLTRAAISIPANIAEGNARGTKRDYAHFVAVSKGSLVEAETYLHIAVRLGYITQTVIAPVISLMNEIGRMLTTLRARLLE